jgi:hypothetical protein
MAGRMVSHYANIYRTRTDYGWGSIKHLETLARLSQDFAPQRIIDFGCGQSKLVDMLADRLNAEGARYDPAIEAYATPPEGRFDLLINTDVLEHIPEAELDDLLSAMRAYADRAFIRIALTPANEILSDGTNAHCTLRSIDWWRERLLKHWPEVHEFDEKNPMACTFLTWKPSEQALQSVRALSRFSGLNASLTRRRREITGAVRLALSPPASEEELLAAIRGKSVALVGNAPSLGEGRRGEEIDGHDLVVRFNRMPLLSYASHGRRTDWLATAFNLGPGHVRRREVKVILWMQPPLKSLPGWVARRGKGFHLYDARRLERLRDKLGAPPSFGARIVDMLMRGAPGAVDLYGFDFMRSGTLSGPRRQPVPHDFVAEETLVKGYAAEGRLHVINPL